MAMNHPNPPGRQGRRRRTELWVGALLAVGLAPYSAAQSPVSGSESSFATARDVPSGGGRAFSLLGQIESSVGHATGGPVVQSESFSFQGSVSWTTGDLPGTGPVVFGVGGGTGTAEGSETESVFGFRFDEPQSSFTVARFGGADAASAVVVSNTVVSTVTPPGPGDFGNPLGLTAVEVENELGSSTAEKSYIFGPALYATDPARLGGTTRVRYVAVEDTFLALGLGGSLPGVAVPIGGIDGALELLSPLILITGLVFSPSGFETFVLPVPDNPQFAGVDVEFQAVSLTALVPLKGSFTNRLAITLVP